MMSDLSVDVVDAHDVVVSEGHPVSTNAVVKWVEDMCVTCLFEEYDLSTSLN
jgi:hypothetical protein